jgi:hypothetical protein
MPTAKPNLTKLEPQVTDGLGYSAAIGTNSSTPRELSSSRTSSIR